MRAVALATSYSRFLPKERKAGGNCAGPAPGLRLFAKTVARLRDGWKNRCKFPP